MADDLPPTPQAQSWRIPRLFVWARFGRDLAVITLGVLIALAFDGWSSARADRRLEREYVSRLIRDIRADSTTLQRQITFALAGESAARALLVLLLHPDSTAPDTMVSRFFSDATRNAFLTANSITLDELKSTGNLRVLRDIKLRESVLSYYFEVVRFQRSIESAMQRGKDPLGELGWDVRAFDTMLPYAANLGDAPPETQSQALRDDALDGKLLERFRAQPAARATAERARTYNAISQTILARWQQSVNALLAQLRQAEP